jgi:hypothetical protein
MTSALQTATDAVNDFLQNTISKTKARMTAYATIADSQVGKTEATAQTTLKGTGRYYETHSLRIDPTVVKELRKSFKKYS